MCPRRRGTLQYCTLLRAKRGVLEIVSDNLSVRHTDTDKNANIFISVVSALFATLDLHFAQAENCVFWTFLQGLFGRPSKTVQPCTVSHAPKGGQNDSASVFSFFTPRYPLYLEMK